MAAVVKIAPLRSLDDFLLKSARFQIPDVNDRKRWINRILNNLVFYQTNYFILFVVVFLSAGIFQSASMIPGSVMAVFAFTWYHSATQKLLEKLDPLVSSVSEERREPIVLLLFWIRFAGYIMLMKKFESASLFMCGVVLLSIFMALTHASLRLRNMENKWANKLESMGAIRTPMGSLLQKTLRKQRNVQQSSSTVIRKNTRSS